MTRVKAALAAGLVLTGMLLVVTLSGSPAVIAHTNKGPTSPTGELAYLTHSGEYCQAGETVPRSTSSVRIWMFALVGHRVQVSIYGGGRKIAGGAHGSGWSGGSVTVPLTPAVRSTVHNAALCLSIQTSNQFVILEGGSSPLDLTKSTVWIEYLRPGKRSWISLAGGIFYRLGLGRSWEGNWVGGMVLAFLAAIIALVSYLVVREAR